MVIPEKREFERSVEKQQVEQMFGDICESLMGVETADMVGWVETAKEGFCLDETVFAEVEAMAKMQRDASMEYLAAYAAIMKHSADVDDSGRAVREMARKCVAYLVAQRMRDGEAMFAEEKKREMDAATEKIYNLKKKLADEHKCRVAAEVQVPGFVDDVIEKSGVTLYEDETLCFSGAGQVDLGEARRLNVDYGEAIKARLLERKEKGGVAECGTNT